MFNPNTIKGNMFAIARLSLTLRFSKDFSNPQIPNSPKNHPTNNLIIKSELIS